MKCGHLKQIKRCAASGAAAFLLAGAMSLNARAETWVQDGTQTWYYQDAEGKNLTGCVQDADTGLWYLLDDQTGAWVARPALDETAAGHLLENAVKKAGYYQKEDNPVVIVVTESRKSKICASVREITGPNSYTNLNNYEIDRRTGHAAGTRGTDVELY